MCPPGMGQSNQLKMVYFMEGAQLATFDPLPACMQIFKFDTFHTHLCPYNVHAVGNINIKIIPYT